MSSETEILLSLKAVYSALGELVQVLERGGFVGGVSLTSLDHTNLVNQDPSNQDPSNPSPLPPSHPADPELDAVLAEVSAKRTAARELFDYWCKVMGKTKGAKFDRKRQRAANIQLAQRRLDELKRAVDGCKLDPFSMGENDRAQVYNDFCLIFRDAAHVEKFLAIADQGGANPQLRSVADPAKLRADANAERRKLETQRLLERQLDSAGRTDPDAAKKRLAGLLAKVGKDV